MIHLTLAKFPIPHTILCFLKFTVNRLTSIVVRLGELTSQTCNHHHRDEEYGVIMFNRKGSPFPRVCNTSNNAGCAHRKRLDDTFAFKLIPLVRMVTIVFI
jgi:hypothetical protein